MQNFHFEEIDSTNNWLKRNLELIPEDGLLWVTADSQTMGRGQHGRSWVSTKGQGLWTSFAYWNKEHADGVVSLEIAAQIVKFLETYGIKTTVKPPNDILVNGKKLCGILCETAWSGDRQVCIVGIGMNVKSSPKDVDQPTTSLLEEGVTVNIQDLLKALQGAMRSC